MEFNKQFDFTNKVYKETNLVSKFDSIKNCLAFINLRVSKENNYIFVSARLIGYTKDEYNLNYVKSNLFLEGQTRYETNISIEEFFNRLKDDEDLLNDTLDTLDYIISKHSKEIESEVNNIKWEK